MPQKRTGKRKKNCEANGSRKQNQRYGHSLHKVVNVICPNCNEVLAENTHLANHSRCWIVDDALASHTNLPSTSVSNNEHKQEDHITNTTYNTDHEGEPYDGSSCSPTDTNITNNDVLCPVYYMDDWKDLEGKNDNDIPTMELNEEDLYEEDSPEVDDNDANMDALENTNVAEQMQYSSLFHMYTEYRESVILHKEMSSEMKYSIELLGILQKRVTSVRLCMTKLFAVCHIVLIMMHYNTYPIMQKSCLL